MGKGNINTWTLRLLDQLGEHLNVKKTNKQKTIRLVHLEIFRTNPVILKTTPVLLTTNAVIFRTTWDRNLDRNKKKVT